MNARQRGAILRRARAIAAANFAEGVKDAGGDPDDDGQALERLQRQSARRYAELVEYLDSLT